MTPLEKRLNSLGQRLIWITIAIAALVAATGIEAGREMVLMIEVSIALAIAVIPEGLPIVATVALARGMLRMASHPVQCPSPLQLRHPHRSRPSPTCL